MLDKQNTIEALAILDYWGVLTCLNKACRCLNLNEKDLQAVEEERDAISYANDLADDTYKQIQQMRGQF